MHAILVEGRKTEIFLWYSCFKIVMLINNVFKRCSLDVAHIMSNRENYTQE